MPVVFAFEAARNRHANNILELRKVARRRCHGGEMKCLIA
jgi:hypothetical protein